MGEKGSVMPVMLLFCFLFASLLAFHAALYMNDLHSTAKEEQVLQLEWLLQNAEQQWVEDRETENGSRLFYQFPDGEVTVAETPAEKETTRVRFIAQDNNGETRMRYFYLEPKKESSDKTE